MTHAEREPDSGVRWPVAVAGFLPPVALSLLPLLHPHPALGAGPVLALPLYLLAAVQASGYRIESGWLAALRSHGVPALALCLLAVAATAALLGWPAWGVYRSGALGSVLLLCAALAALLFAFGSSWPAAGLVYLDTPPSPRQRSWRHALRLAQRVLGAGTGLRGAFATLVLLLWCALALAIAATGQWPVVWPRLWPALGYALVWAPLAAWCLIECSARQLLAADGAGQPALPEGVLPVVDMAGPDAGPAPLPGDPVSQLYAAALAGRVDEALALIEAGVDPHALPDPSARDQRSLAVLAALLSDLRLLRALIAAGVDLNQPHAGLSPLLAVTRDSWHGRPEAVMTLLANGADPRLTDAEGRSPMHGAALSTDPAVAALLLDAGAPIDAVDRGGRTPLAVACANGNWRMARFLLEHGARAEPESGQPVLLAAAGGDDDPAGVALLLKHKARVDRRGRLNRSALHVACLAGNATIAQSLLDAGADVDARDDNGVTPLLEAARAGSVETLRVLARHRPDPRAADGSGRNALAIGCQGSRADVALVSELLALGVDPQQACNDGRRAIDYAVAAGRWSLVARLDPAYPLPACVADADEELADVPPLARLRVALEARRHDHLRELLPLLRDRREEVAALLLEFAPQLDRPALQLLLPACEELPPDASGDGLGFRLLAGGPAAQDAIRVLLGRGGQPGGAGGLARYLAAPCALPAGDEARAEALALELLACGADASGPDADGNAPLLLALRRDWPRLVAALLARGVDPDVRDPRGTTALILACSLGQEDAVRRLIAHGAQPELRAIDGQTALGLALATGRREIARWLDWAGWRLPRRPLREADLPAAAQDGDSGAVLRLLDLGLPLDARDAQGCTALLRACGGGHLALVETLLERGADPSLPARSGATCLSAALSARHDAVVQALLVRGASPDQTLPGGITPLMVAAALGQSKGAQALLAHGADVRAQAEDGGTALHAAAQYGFGARDKLRAIALWDALLASGADPDAVNGSGQTPLLLLLGARAEAGATCNEDVVLAQLERLLSRGVELGVKERRGFGPLHLAALHGLGRVVRALLAAGADPDARDSINRRPHEIALMRGFVDIAAEFEAPRQAPSIARFLRPS